MNHFGDVSLILFSHVILKLMNRVTSQHGGGGGSLHSQVEHHVQDKFCYSILYGIDKYKFYDIFSTYT